MTNIFLSYSEKIVSCYPISGRHRLKLAPFATALNYVQPGRFGCGGVHKPPPSPPRPVAQFRCSPAQPGSKHQEAENVPPGERSNRRNEWSLSLSRCEHVPNNNPSCGGWRSHRTRYNVQAAPKLGPNQIPLKGLHRPSTVVLYFQSTPLPPCLDEPIFLLKSSFPE